MPSDLLPSVEVQSSVPPRSAVIWLHGLGADGHDFEPLVPYLGVSADHAVRFVFPHAPSRPVTINDGMVMPAWYDIRDLGLRREIDLQGLAEASAQVRELVAHEIECGIPAARIVLAGFSQGGAVALDAALRFPSRLAGLLALSTYLVGDAALEQERSEANRELGIFQAHGLADPMVPLAAGELARDRLIELGYRVEWKTYPMGHEVHPAEVRDIGEVLNRFLSS